MKVTIDLPIHVCNVLSFTAIGERNVCCNVVDLSKGTTLKVYGENLHVEQSFEERNKRVLDRVGKICGTCEFCTDMGEIQNCGCVLSDKYAEKVDLDYTCEKYVRIAL